MLAHSTSGEGGEAKPFKIPFQDFTGDEGLALLKILYAKQFELTSIDSAYTAARFGHKYDAQLLLKSADAYLSRHVFPSDQPQVRVLCQRSLATGRICIDIYSDTNNRNNGV